LARLLLLYRVPSQGNLIPDKPDAIIRGGNPLKNSNLAIITRGRALLLAVLLASPLATGCAAVALSGATMGAGYSYMNVADKTSNYPVEYVHLAVTEALDRMDIEIVEDNETDDGREIVAKAGDLEIDIDLESITFKTTRISVDASKAMVVKDRATAVEIISQTQRILEASNYNPERNWRHVIQRCVGRMGPCAGLET